MAKAPYRDLDKILADHDVWLSSGGKKGSRAVLRDMDLRDADLRRRNLRDADLSNTNLRGANLEKANLRGANFIGADLAGAHLAGANIRTATVARSWGMAKKMLLSAKLGPMQKLRVRPNWYGFFEFNNVSL